MNRATGSSSERSPTTAANIGRILWGLVFIASSIVNLTVTLLPPRLLPVADPERRYPQRPTDHGAIVVFEFAVGMLTLSKNKWTVICPAVGWYTIGSPLFLIIL